MKRPARDASPELPKLRHLQEFFLSELPYTNILQVNHLPSGPLVLYWNYRAVVVLVVFECAEFNGGKPRF